MKSDVFRSLLVIAVSKTNWFVQSWILTKLALLGTPRFVQDRVGIRHKLDGNHVGLEF